jgi:hypothetical protein
MVANVGVVVIYNYVCMLLQTEVTSTSRKSSIFPARVPLVFQLDPGTGKSFVHAENAKTSGIGPVRNKIRTGLKNIRRKLRGAANLLVDNVYYLLTYLLILMHLQRFRSRQVLRNERT